jgi:hypothetical protein
MNRISALEENRIVRTAGVTAYRFVARAMIFGSGPPVLANSIPKAGTHLLTSLLSRLPRMMFSGRHYAFPEFAPLGSMEPDWTLVKRALSSVNKGQFATAHFPSRPQLSSLLGTLGYRTVFMLRDPRDIVISNAFYISRSKRHHRYERFNREFADTSECIMACITGLPSDKSGPALDSIGQRVREYLPWVDEPTTYACRFEDLIGASGGGAIERQRREIETIAAHVGHPLSTEQVGRLARSIWSPRSPTFRQGEIGDWRNHFTGSHKVAFKTQAGRELIALGYELDEDW